MPNDAALSALRLRPEVTAAVTLGAARLLRNEGCAVLGEFKLANGRRADLVGLDAKGRFSLIEVKSCLADFEVDSKWHEYLDYSDAFYFAVAEDFPVQILPQEEGLIIADRFGGAIVRPAIARPLNAARRRAVTLRYARQAASGRLAIAGEDSAK